MLRLIYLFSCVLITWLPRKVYPDCKENEPVYVEVLLESNDDLPVFPFLPVPGVPSIANDPIAEPANKNKMANFFKEGFNME